MRPKNTEAMAAIIKYVEEYYTKHSKSPSIRTIAEATGYSRGIVHRCILHMKEEGVIEYDGKNIINDNIERHKSKGLRVPIVGDVACGIPNTAEEHIESFVTLPEAIFGSGELFMLRARGDSMIDVGINEGDLVLIKKQNTADDGDIVVALVDEEATLKRIYKESGKIRLHPENKEMDDIIVDDCIIQGVLVSAIKFFKC